MPFKFEMELRLKAKEWIAFIASYKFTGEIPLDGFRDYLVKITIVRDGRSFGNLNLYYSPSKQNYSLKTNELRDSSITTELETLWVRFIGGIKEVNAVQKDYEAYVDGSFIEGKIGYGVLVLYQGKIFTELFGPVVREDLLSMRQIGGELYAVNNLIEWAQENIVKEVHIYYDYLGIEMWANGQWKAQQAFVSDYVKLVRDCEINIHWHKVQGHAGNSWNERADLLARKGALGNQIDPQKSNNIDEVINIVEKFIVMASKKGFQVVNKGVINNQCMRIVCLPNGILDIYNSKKRSWKTPYFHDFKDSHLEAKIMELWQEHIQNLEPIQEEDLFYEVEYYLKILRPYRDCRFDFIQLAEALNQVATGLNQPEFDIQLLRYDFINLENMYQQIKENYRD